MTKQQRVEKYNKNNSGYNITGIRRVQKEHLDWLAVNGAKSLDELYNTYSDAKRSSYDYILRNYKPIKVIGLQGSSMAYSIALVANNGDTLWITKDNNYLVEVV